ncbi:MAG: adenosylmethionine decarboxylase [Alphaproteobacteria bacterium]
MSKVSLAQLGMNSEVNPRDTHRVSTVHRPSDRTEPHLWPVVDNGKDYFIERDGVKFAGMHLLIDLWGATNLDKIDVVEAALKESAEEAGATLLHTHLHHFSPNGGISGVLVLAESHISIHTWPERSYAALDVFMCGDCDPYKAIPILRRAFRPTHVNVGEQKRGLVT